VRTRRIWREAWLIAGLGAVAFACTSFGSNATSTAANGDAGTTLDGTGATDASADARPGDAAQSHPCNGGRCVVLTSSESNLEELRVAGDRVLYRADLHVHTVGIGGGLPTTLVPCANRGGLAVTDVGFYSWCNNTLTLRDVADAGQRAVASVDGFSGAAGGGWFIFQEALGNLFRLPASLVTAGLPSKIDYVPNGVFRSLATNSSDLFYMTTEGALFHTALGASSPTQLESAQTTPSEIAVDDAAVFWATDSDSDKAVLHGRVFSAGASTPLASELNHPDGVAIDASYVYVSLRGTPPAHTNGAIIRVSRSGGDVETLADGLVYPSQIVVTDRFVLWTSKGARTDAGFVGGAIDRLEK
jgi:hypothetical protein